MRLPVYNKTFVNKTDGMNADIITAIHENFFTAVPQAAQIAHQFKGETRKATAFNIWNFLRTRLTYKKDPDTLQMIKLPGRLIADGYGDCKSYSLFTAAVLGALGLPVYFRYVSYTGSRTPSHVYTFTTAKNGAPIIIDGVYNKFDQELPYTFKKDVQVIGKRKNSET